MWSYVSLVNNIAISTYCDGVSIYYNNESLGEHFHLAALLLGPTVREPNVSCPGVNMVMMSSGLV